MLCHDAALSTCASNRPNEDATALCVASRHGYAMYGKAGGPRTPDRRPSPVYLLCDGHGGNYCSTFVTNALAHSLSKHSEADGTVCSLAPCVGPPDARAQVGEVLTRMYHALDAEYLRVSSYRTVYKTCGGQTAAQHNRGLRPPVQWPPPSTRASSTWRTPAIAGRCSCD